MTSYSPNLDEIPMEFRPLIRASIARLTDEYKGTFAPEVVERFVYESIEALEGAKVKKFIPLLAERFAGDRLWALAKSEGLADVDTPTVLFLCVQNAGRSQMAAGFMDHIAGDRVKVMSGGSAPGRQVHDLAVQAMEEKGIDITKEFPKPWTYEVVKAADVVITMGCGDACPIYPGKRYEDWDVTDPAELELEGVRRVRDEIERRVRALLAELETREPAMA